MLNARSLATVSSSRVSGSGNGGNSRYRAVSVSHAHKEDSMVFSSRFRSRMATQRIRTSDKTVMGLMK